MLECCATTHSLLLTSTLDTIKYGLLDMFLVNFIAPITIYMSRFLVQFSCFKLWFGLYVLFSEYVLLVSSLEWYT
jgi:hypothetical protein